MQWASILIQGIIYRCTHPVSVYPIHQTTTGSSRRELICFDERTSNVDAIYEYNCLPSFRSPNLLQLPGSFTVFGMKWTGFTVFPPCSSSSIWTACRNCTEGLHTVGWQLWHILTVDDKAEVVTFTNWGGSVFGRYTFPWMCTETHLKDWVLRFRMKTYLPVLVTEKNSAKAEHLVETCSQIVFKW
jgi:hypothetical protein